MDFWNHRINEGVIIDLISSKIEIIVLDIGSKDRAGFRKAEINVFNGEKNRKIILGGDSRMVEISDGIYLHLEPNMRSKGKEIRIRYAISGDYELFEYKKQTVAE